nr:synapsin-1 [Oryctolagus cuniculus]
MHFTWGNGAGGGGIRAELLHNTRLPRTDSRACPVPQVYTCAGTTAPKDVSPPRGKRDLLCDKGRRLPGEATLAWSLGPMQSRGYPEEEVREGGVQGTPGPRPVQEGAQAQDGRRPLQELGEGTTSPPAAPGSSPHCPHTLSGTPEPQSRLPATEAGSPVTAAGGTSPRASGPSVPQDGCTQPAASPSRSAGHGGQRVALRHGHFLQGPHKALLGTAPPLESTRVCTALPVTKPADTTSSPERHEGRWRAQGPEGAGRQTPFPTSAPLPELRLEPLGLTPRPARGQPPITEARGWVCDHSWPWPCTRKPGPLEAGGGRCRGA